MKHSIRIKMSLWVIILILTVIMAGGFVVNYYLEDFYLDSKITALKEAYSELEYLDPYNTEDIANLNEICETNGVTLVMIDQKRQLLYNFGPQEAMNDRINQFLFGTIKNNGTEQVTLEKSDNYNIVMSTDLRHDNAMHIEMFGTTGDGEYYMLRVAISNVRESIYIVNKFYGVMLAVIIVIVFLAIMIITTMFTKPVLQLAEISKRMSRLDFDAKYKVTSDDEIGVLGSNINEMSLELEKTISDLKAANIELKKDIDRKNEIENMRNDFISNVSHELKTPIALIQGYAEGLKDGISDDPDSREFYCDVIIDESAKMNRMVRNLLTLNQIEFGDDKVVMERFDITMLVKGVINSQKINAEKESIKLEFDQEEPIYVWGDEFQIEEVVTNYVSNAFNHVSGNKLIKVQITQKDGIVRMSVFNTGDNIPQEDINRIWEKFYKVDKARTREYGGNGIGLSIVKAIIERMGKQCGVINREDGVEFWFEIDGVNFTENM